MTSDRKTQVGRRSFLLSAGAVAAVPLLGWAAKQAPAQPAAPNRLPAPDAIGRRRLGSLEVSSVGLGVQNMSRTYQTTIPSRPAARGNAALYGERLRLANAHASGLDHDEPTDQLISVERGDR